MNKIFKVIWSKSKQCYVVVSEMAKNTTGKKKIVVASILAGLATQSCSVMAAGAPSSSNNVWGATTPGGVAIGQNSVASGATAVDPATGTVRVAPSIAIGLASSSAGLDTITIGIGAGNTKSYGISMGKQTNVGGDYGIAIGYQTSAMSDHAVAIGEQTRAPKMGATVMGVSARGYGQGSVSLGWQALAGADVYGSGINIGTNPYNDTAATINSYQKWGDTAIGLRAVATGGNATALGRSARAAAENSIAIGGGNGDNFNNNTEKTEASAAKATAIGYNAKATAGDTLALGTSSKASGSDALAVGVNANASNSDSIAIGQDTVSNNINSVAFGRSSQATGSSATALGAHTKAIDTGAVAIGLKAEATKEGSISIGQQSAASGLKAITTGYLSAASDENAAAYGNTAKAVGKNSLALGANTQATVEGGVALGAGSIANTVAGAGYNPNTGRTNTFTGLSGNALTSTWAAVSIGDGTNTRQLTGLAAGTNNTDAVNVAQLKSMNLAFTADGSTKGDINLTNSALNVVGDSTYITTKGNNQTLTISGKKQNITVTNGTASASAGMADANNVAQAINQANADQTISYKANGGTANTVKVSDGLNFTNGASTVATVGANGQVTYDLNTTTKQSITDSSTAVNRTIALGGSTGSTTAKKLASGDVKFNIKGQTGTSALITTSATGDDVTIAPTSKLTDAVTAAENAANKDLSNLSTAGNTNIKNLAKTAAAWNVSTNGSGTTTVSGGDTVNFVNGDNIAVTNTGRTITIGTAKNVSFDKVTVGGVVLDKTDGINAGNKEIKGIATGTTATSAVNKQQMDDAVKAASDATTALGKNTIALGSDSGSTSAKKLNTSAITFNIKGDTGANALITTTATGDNVSITPTAKLTNAVAAAENAANKNLSNISSSGETVIKNLAKGAAQDAVKVAGTGLATVSDNTTGGVKTYTVDVNTGNLVVTANGQVGAAGTTGASGATGSNGVATTQNVATAINDAVTKAKASTTQALADAEHKFDGDTGTTSVRKHGEVLSIKGGVTNAASLTTGNIGVVSDGAGTLNIRLAKVLSGLTSATFTTASGNTTVINGDGVTITPSGTGASAISMTTAGINAGNKEIKGVATATSADAAVNKAQMETAIANAQTAATSTEKVVAKTLSGDTNLATVTGQTGTAKGETYEVAVSENAVKNVAKAAAQDAVTVTGTGLATVSDNTAAGVKTYTVNVDEGKLVIDDTTGKVGAAGSTQGTTAGKNGVATTQNVATAINDAVTKANANNAQALADAKHNFAGDDATVISRKHGEQLNIKGGASTTATDLTSGNIAVVGDTASGTLNIKMAKALTGLTSATFTDGSGNTQTVTGGSSTISDAAGNSTVVSKGGVTTTDAAGNITTTAPTGVTVTPAGTGTTPISVTTSGISAGNKEIKNIANGTTDDAAVNKKQMDDAVKAASDATKALGDNTVSLGSESGSTTAKKLSTTGGITFNIKGDTGANALITTSATGDNVTIAPTAKLTAAVTAAEKSADKDLSNLSTAGDTYIKNLAKTAASWNVETNGGGTTAVAGGESVNFINGDNIAITNAGRAITIGTAKNVSFDKVTVGGIVLDKTDGINAGGKEVKGIADGTAADSAVSKGQMETAIANAQTAATSTEKVIAKTLTGDTNLATVTGQTGTAKGETYEVAVSENAVKNVAKAAAQDAVTVTGTGLATVSDNTTGGVKTYTVNVDEGKLVLDDTTGQIGANGSTQGTTAGKNGVATTQNVATAINDAVTKANANNAQALADAKHNFAGDDATVISRKHGEQLNIKGGASTTATDLTSGNIAVVGDTASGTLNIKMAKALTGLTSATFTDGSGNTQTVTGASSTIADGAGNTTTMTKGGLSTTDGTNTTTVAPAGVTATDGTNTVKLNGSGIDAGNTQIKNVGKATTDDAAVNKKQMDDAVKSATDATTALGNNTIALGSDAGSTTAKKLSTNAITFNIKGDTGANALITTSATGDNVTIAPTAKLTAAVTAAEKSADKDLSNISSAGKTVIKDLAVTSAQDAVNVTGTGLATVSDNTTGGVKTYTVNVDEGKLVLDDTTGKIGANGSTQGTTAGKNGVATTQNVATAINDAITKSNANTAQALADAEHKFDGDTGTTSVRKHGEVLSIKGGVTTPADLTTGNIGVVSDGAGTLNIRLAKVLSGLTSATFKDASGNTTMVTGGSTTIADTAGNTQTLAPTKSEIKDTNGVSTVTTKDGVTAKDASGQTTSLTKGGVNATDGNGNTTSLTNTGVSATDGHGHTTGLTNGGLSTTDGTNTTTVAPTGITATDGTNTVKLNGSGIDAGNTEIKNVGKATTDDAAVNKKQMDDAITKATADATHEFGGDDATVVSRKHGEKLTIKGGASTNAADFTSGNIAVIGDATNGALNIKLAKALTGLTSATFTDTAGNTTTVTGGSTTIADTSGNTQTLAPTKSEIKDNNGVSTVTTKDGVTAKDASGQTTSLTKGGVDATDGNGNTTSLTNTGVSATDGNGHTTGLTNGGLSTTDGTNTTTVAPTGITATDGTNTVKLNGSGIDAGNTEIKNVGKATTDDAAVNKKQMDDAITKATADATHDFAGDDATVISRKHGEQLNIKGGASTTATDLTSGNIAVIGDTTTGTLNIKLAKVLTGLTSATFTDTSGNTTTVTGGSTTIADTSGNTQTLAPTKSEIKDNNGVSTVTTKDGVTAKDASGQMTSLTKGGVDATDGHGHTTGLTNGGLSTTDGTNTTTVAPTGMTATDGSHTVKVDGSGIDAGNTEIKHIAAGTSADSAVNKGQMDDAITKATADATHEFAGDTGSNSVRKHGEVLSIKGGVTDTNKLSDNNIGVISDGAGTLNVKLSKNLTGLTSSTFTDGSGNTQTITGASSTITDGTGNTTAMTKGGLSTTDGTNTTTVAPTGVTATDGTNIVKLNGSGIDAGNTQIKNVGKATTDDAAVNKKQMDEAVKAASDATKALGNNTISLGDDSGSTTTAKTLNTTGGIQFNIKGQTGTDALITTSASGDDVTITPTAKLTAAVTAAEKSADKDLSNLSAAGNTHIQDLAKSAASWNVQTNGKDTTAVVGGDTVNFINGDNIAITNTGHAITIGTAKNVSFDKVTVGGMTLDKNGILSGISSITGSGTGAPTMTFNSQNGNTPANVSINSNLDMGGHRITGVGPAEKPTDAVNKQQVDQALRGLAGLADNAARQYASKAGANAAALAALKPIQYDPLEPTQIMAGVGNYKSQTAVALGMAHYTNENTMFNIGVSLDSHDNMVNAGVTHKFGYSPEKKAIPDRYKGGPISSIYVMQDEMQALLAKDQEKDAVISKQASEIDTLRQQNEDMQRKIDMILAKLQ